MAPTLKRRTKKESLDQFFQILGPERCKKIKTVAKDLHAPYAASCQEYIPHAIEVADPFHVVKKLNETMDECRKELSVGSVLPISKRKAIFRLNWVLRYKQENQSEKNLKSLSELAKIRLGSTNRKKVLYSSSPPQDFSPKGFLKEICRHKSYDSMNPEGPGALAKFR